MQSKIKLEKGEKLDDLLIDDRKIIQNPSLYMFSSDAVRLANFVKLKKTDRVVELCSGSGIIGILLALQRNFKSIDMIEIQTKLADMSNRSIMMNDLQEKITVHNMRLQECHKVLGTEFNAVFCNPPFEKNIVDAKNESSVIARCEKLVNIGEICYEASKLLKFGGRFYCCFPASRVFELNYYLNNNDICIKNIECLFDKFNKARLVLVEGVKGAKQGCIIKGICK